MTDTTSISIGDNNININSDGYLKVNNKIAVTSNSILDDTSGDVIVFDNTGNVKTAPQVNITSTSITIGNPLVMSIDLNNKRVGINKLPEEDFDIDGNIQVSTGGTEKITFYDTQHQHEHGRILFTNDLTDGSEFEIFTLTNGDNQPSQKLTINNIGAIGIGSTPTYGKIGQALISNSETSSISWVNKPGRYLSCNALGVQFTGSNYNTVTFNLQTSQNAGTSGVASGNGQNINIPVTGYYKIHVTALISGLSTAFRSSELEILNNSNIIKSSKLNFNTPDMLEDTRHITFTEQLNSGDNLTVAVKTDLSGNWDLTCDFFYELL
jgi:hypothetical protein